MPFSSTATHNLRDFAESHSLLYRKPELRLGGRLIGQLAIVRSKKAARAFVPTTYNTRSAHEKKSISADQKSNTTQAKLIVTVVDRRCIDGCLGSKEATDHGRTLWTRQRIGIGI